LPRNFFVEDLLSRVGELIEFPIPQGLLACIPDAGSGTLERLLLEEEEEAEGVRALKKLMVN
jgi:hypothetical protein